MRRALSAMLLLLLVAPSFSAQDDKPAKPPAIELMTLYKQAGRSWTYRVIHSIRGESPDVETSTTRIAKFEDGRADCVTETEAADRSRFSTSRFQVDAADVPEDAKAWVADVVPLETLDMGFREFPCKKHVVKTDARQTTTWVSTEYHPLIVKQVTIEAESTAIRKLTAFNAADVDPWQLYRMQGRRWKLKSTTTAGGNPMVTFTENTVKEVREEGVTLTMSVQDATGKAMFTQDTEIKFTPPSAVAGRDSAEPKMTMETKTCEAGEFNCYMTDLNGTKVWSSVQWPGLLVAASSKANEMELVEFDLGHDAHKFYRTAGNFYVMNSTTKLQGMQFESSVRYEVKSVEGLDVTWVHTMYDDGGNETMTQESKLTLPEETETMAFSNQLEEMIETPAGRLPAIRTETNMGDDGTTIMWMWNGIVVRMETRMEGIELVQELAEINWQ